MSRGTEVLVCALLALTAASAHAETDASFLLHAGLKDLPDYFPGYLGNGYLGTLTAPRGSEATPTYLVAFMDYTAGDMSRPAQVPGWSFRPPRLRRAPRPSGAPGWPPGAPPRAAGCGDPQKRCECPDHRGLAKSQRRWPRKRD